jgi:hypothetical protein
MEQTLLFVADIYDALSDVVRACGGPKRVGCELRPEKPADEAAKWVKDCLNRERRERFTPDHVHWLLRRGRAAGCHTLMQWLATDCGYAEPVPVDPEDERARLQRDFVEATRSLMRLSEKLGIDAKLPDALRVVR